MNQMRHHFGIRFRNETITAFNHQLAQRFMVFDNAVMDDDNIFRNVRMRIFLRRLAVGCPPGMGNPGAATQRMLFGRLGQNLNLSQTPQTGDLPFIVNHGQTGGVVTTVFKTT